ncbi:MAG: (d)CMP kinase [Polyangiaceae bacterium]|nr:(d)CMP kinase [Polyangiaceae bacterium]
MSPTARRPVIALDGPAGAGKSTVARRVAAALGYVLVDTGALYRAVALACARAGVSWDDPDGVGAQAEALVARGAIALVPAPDGLRVELDRADVTREIRSPENSLGASRVSAVPRVRAALLEMQRASLRGGGAVMEGRDIGTVVAPDAEVKLFVTASPEVRARRRHDELVARGERPSYEDTLRDVLARDRADESRAIAPLVPAADAEVLDTSSMSLDEVVDAIVARARAAGG